MPRLNRVQQFALAVRPLARRVLPEWLRTTLGTFVIPPTPGKRRMELLMDVVGTCNLRCPSCPVGNMEASTPAGLTDVHFFNKIIEKADEDYWIQRVSLYNWGESFLHPQLPELIAIVKQRHLYCALSTNLNVLRNPEAILAAGPDELRISLSGFHQETYGKTHAGGNIERVKANMARLAAAKRQLKARQTRVVVYFHKYRNNLADLEPMREFATRLGFEWMENWAFYMPLEKVLALAEGKLTEAERAFVDHEIALPMLPALAEAKKFAHEPCRLWAEQIVLDFQGNAALCCGVYDLQKNRLGNFLEMTPGDLMQAKTGHPTCQRCTTHGIHRYGEYYDHPVLKPKYEELVANAMAAIVSVANNQVGT